MPPDTIPAMGLARLSPFGPIFGKELRTTARRKRTYWLRFIYLLSLFLFLLLAYTSTSVRSYNVVSVAAQSREEAELGHAFFQTFAVFSIFAMPLIAPILTATAISAERLGRTLSALLMTPITSWQVVSGKLFSRLLIALMLLCLSLPVLAVVRLLGGVDLDAMIEVICLCAATALAAAALGLFFSSFMNRAYAVILLSYLAMGFIYGFIPFILVLSIEATQSRRGGGPPLGFLQYMGATNPIFQVMMRVIPGGRMMAAVGWGWCVAFHLGVASLLVWATGVMLRRHVRREGEVASRSPEFAAVVPPPLLDAAGINPAPPLPYASAATPHHRSAKPRRDVGDNPVLWREIRRPLFNKRWQSLVGAGICIVLLCVTYIMLANQWTNELTRPDCHVGYACIFCALLTLLTCVVSATSIAAEKESDTWTLLLATPLGARSILYGKALGVLRRLMWPAILILAHFLFFTATGIISWTAFFTVIWVMVTFNALWLATGIYFSLRLKNNTFAVVANLLAPVAVCGAIPLIMLIIGNILFDRRADRAVEWTTIYLPYMYLGYAIEGMPGAGFLSHDLSNRYWSWGIPTQSLWLPYTEGGVSPASFVSAAVMVGAIHLLAAWALMTRMVRHFNPLVGRAAQRTPLPPPPIPVHRPNAI